MAEFKSEKLSEKGSVYFGRAAGGSFAGSQILIVAPDDETLAEGMGDAAIREAQ